MTKISWNKYYQNSEKKNNENEILLGDFNFIDNENDKANGLNSTDRQVCKTWLHFLAESNLVDPFRAQTPTRRLWSFIGTGKAKNSRIDRVYVNSENMKNITNIKYTPTPFHGHRILTFQVSGREVSTSQVKSILY